MNLREAYQAHVHNDEWKRQHNDKQEGTAGLRWSLVAVSCLHRTSWKTQGGHTQNNALT